MERQIAEDRRQMAEDRRERREMQEQLSTLLGSQGSGQRSLRHFSASAPLFHEGPMNSLPRQSSISAQQACELLSIGGRVVAFGTISTNSDGTTYKVIIDEVEDWTAELFGVIGKTFGNIDVGHTVDWPLFLTRLV
ncbi:hypothetical protein AQUCO_01200102v1 [Aquilegia coerulea]|uniref:Uncharacterized protein n=1 Tax=Aquilegia coerulea TaxID=218851 RepID=A0A2G5E4H6_AQUCA|nr:hypothetical protein AQUCO_01200102v1 [Aquilegia coerulea]